MWTLLTIIAAISLVASFPQGRNAIWGGATVGLFIAVIVALSKNGFDWSILLKGSVIGALVGVGAEALGRVSDVARNTH